MKKLLIVFLTLASITTFGQKKPLIPDLIAAAEKIPVVTDYLKGYNPRHKSGVYLFEAELGPDGQTTHSDQILLPKESVEIVKQVIEEMNKTFDTDKFYYQPIEELKEDPPFFASFSININYKRINLTQKPGSDWKYNVIVLPALSFFYLHPKNGRSWPAGPWATGRADIGKIPIGNFEVGENYNGFSDLVAIHPYEPYLVKIKNNIEPGLARVNEKIMKRYAKKKK